MVCEEVALTEERGEVVISIGIVGEPTQLVCRVSIRGALLGVGNPLSRLQVDFEDSVSLELALDQRVLITRGLTVVVRVVLKVELDGRLNAGVSKTLLCGLSAGATITVTVQVLEHLSSAGQSIRNVGVQRQVGALVNLVRDFLAVKEVSNCTTNGERLRFISFRSLRTKWLRVEVEDDVADLSTGADDDIDVVVVFKVSNIGRRKAAVCDVDVSLLNIELQVRSVGVVLESDAVGRCGTKDTLVVRISLERDDVVEVVAIDHVLAGKSISVDDNVIGSDRIGREHFFVNNRCGRARQNLRERLVVTVLQVEDDSGVVDSVNALDVSQKNCRPVLITDRDLTVEAELHIR